MRITPTTRKTLDYCSSILRNYEVANISRIIHPDDDMANGRLWDYDHTHYFNVGRDALEIILSSMILSQISSVKKVLDLPCGFGRVARHLAAAFQDAELTCVELYQDRVDFCRDTFGAVVKKSKEDFDELQFQTKFDIIWCGSLLSHMPEPLFKKALAMFSRSLAPDGIAVITTQGRHSPYIQKHLWKYMADDMFEIAERGYRASGFGYADYNAKSQFYEQDEYGITLASGSWIMNVLNDDPTIRIQAFMERRWDQCQDVLVFKKRGIHDADPIWTGSSACR